MYSPKIEVSDWFWSLSRWFSSGQHPEKVQSAIDRYINEIKRVSGVLDRVLEGRKYLVGDKCTYADLSFITWQTSILKIIGYDQAKEYPNLQAWLDRMIERPIIKAIMEEREARMALMHKWKAWYSEIWERIESSENGIWV